MMLIDGFMPEFDFSEKHEIEILAPAEKVFDKVKSVDICDSAIVRWLFRLRGLPTEGFALERSNEINFITLGELGHEELVLGIIGKFWTPTGRLQKFDPKDFIEFDTEGFAKATWNFSVEEVAIEKTLLATETRIKALDESSRTKFGFYWTFVKPFSGLVRTEMLSIVKQNCEQDFQ